MLRRAPTMCIARIIAHVSLGALLVLAAPVSGAYAATPPPAAIAQYVETVPNGSSKPDVHHAAVAPVAKAVAERIATQGHKDAGALKQVVSNPSLGAPVEKPTTKLRRHQSFAPYARASLASAIASAIGGSGTLLGLCAGLLGLAALFTVARLVARRTRAITPGL